MVLLYMVLHGSHQQKKPINVSINIPAPFGSVLGRVWIYENPRWSSRNGLSDIIYPSEVTIFLGVNMGKSTIFTHIIVNWSFCWLFICWYIHYIPISIWVWSNIKT